MENFKKLGDALSGEIGGVIASLILVLILFIMAIVTEKKYKIKENNYSKTKKITFIGMLSALSAILMLFEIPLPFVPEFYKIDLSEVPVLVGSFMMGPIVGIFTELLKVVIKTIIKGSSTAYVGELANFIVGCAFIIPAAVIYRIKNNKKFAIISLSIGTISMTIVGAFLNAFVLLPAFAYLYGGMPVSSLISMGTAINGAITNLFTFIIFAVVPLNIIKGVLVSFITFLVYKRISKEVKKILTK